MTNKTWIKTSAVAGLVAWTCAMASAAQGETRRVPFVATFATTSRLVNYGTPGYTAEYFTRCQGAPVLEIQGAGDASLLGVMTDIQSHCLALPGPADPTALPFFNGVFTFTDARGRTITGQYSGKLVPTNTSVPPTMGPPQGAWIIVGAVCISGGTRVAGIVNDCAAGRYSPARGTTVLNPFVDDTNPATLFLDQTIGVRD
jgi:hypothetical protein